MTAGALHVVAYDIGNRKRWRRASRLLKQHGARCQLSVFLVRATPATIARLSGDLRAILDGEEDALLIAPVDERVTASWHSFGRTGAVPIAQVVIV